LTTATKIEPGIHYAMPRQQYDELPAFNQSTLKRMIQDTPAHARHAQLFPEPPSDAMVLGLAFEALLLGGDPEYQAHYSTWQGLRRQGKEWEAFEARELAAGKIILTTAQDQAAKLMVLSIREHATASRLFSRGGAAQAVLVWDEGGLPCKARLDQLFTDDWPTIGDLKTASSIKTEDLERAIVNYGYDVQAAFYKRGAKALGLGERVNYLLSFIESGGNAAYPKPGIVNAAGQPRFAVRVLEIDDRTVARGTQLVEAGLDLYRSCRACGRWECYSDRVERISAPAWALKEVA